MSATTRRPVGLGPRGRRFWRRLSDAFELSDAELELLSEACRVLDAIDGMSSQLVTDGLMSTGSAGQPIAHPLVAEIRAQRDLLARLIGRLALPAEDVDGAASIFARRGANARWYGKPKSLKGA
jgi:hypothetical protein